MAADSSSDATLSNPGARSGASANDDRGSGPIPQASVPIAAWKRTSCRASGALLAKRGTIRLRECEGFPTTVMMIIITVVIITKTSNW